MDHRRALGHIVVIRLAGDRIDRVLAQIAFRSRERDRLLEHIRRDLAPEALVDEKRERAGILTKRSSALLCDCAIVEDRLQDNCRGRTLRLLAQRRLQRFQDIVRKRRARFTDKL